MKKLLIGTSALVAAVAFAGTANAADPLKLSLGGFGSVFVGYADNDDSAIDALGGEVTNVDVKGDNEVHFKASSTLDNGLTVGAKYEMNLDSNGEPNDEWDISLAGSFGTFIAGAQDAATEAVAFGAPHMGGRLLGAGASEGDLISGSAWVLNPGVNVMNATFVNSGDQEQISYISPSIAGFTAGATYIPDLGAAGTPWGVPLDGSAGGSQMNGGLPVGSNTSDLYGAGAMYNGEFSGVSVGVSAGYAIADAATNLAGVGNIIDDWSQWQAHAKLGYAGFQVSGGYSQQNLELNSTAGGGDTDATAWELGVGYKTGPYGIALAYFNSNVETGGGDDEAQLWQLTSQYEMGPGILLVGGIGWADFDNGEAGAANLQNDGWTVVTGLNLAF